MFSSKRFQPCLAGRLQLVKSGVNRSFQAGRQIKDAQVDSHLAHTPPQARLPPSYPGFISSFPQPRKPIELGLPVTRYRQDVHGIESLPPSPSPYRIRERPYGATRRIRTIIIGAGVSGIDMLLSLKKSTKNVSSVIYEKNAGIGGTWLENRYPGCASDDPSHSYQYTHSPNVKWSSIFAPAREIETYLNDVVDSNDLRKRIKCTHSVLKSEWAETKGQWKVTVRDNSSGTIFIDRAEVLVDATGIFNNWKWPEVDGLHNFKGDLVHTACWSENIDLGDKVVAVLGNGASGVQLVPAIQQSVKKLVHVIRSKTWIAPPSTAVKLCQQYTIEGSRQFSEEAIKDFQLNPTKYAQFLSELNTLAGKERFRIITDVRESKETRAKILAYMKSSLQSKPELIDVLIPNFAVGCRRITASPNFLKALTASNVSVTNSPIKRVTATGIEFKDGRVMDVDAIICATGFNTSFIPRFPLIGEQGKNLQDEWSEENGGPQAYMSIMVKGMPNYFRFIGPNGPLAHGAIPQLVTHISTYVLAHIRKLQTEHLSSIRPHAAAVDEFNQHAQALLPRTAWAGSNCGGWYKAKGKNGEEGRVTTVHPGSQKHWEEMLRRVRWEDFELRRVEGRAEVNRFAYLGNGFLAEEVEAF